MSQLRGKSAKELLNLVAKVVPPLKAEFRKGQAGRIVVFGGCEDYTGAPYFSAYAAAVFGADLSHIICERNAAPIIKTYSPDLMVHPYLYEKDNIPEKYQDSVDKFLEEKVLPKVKSLLSRIHVAVVGPGLGRDELMLKTLEIVIKHLKENQVPIIIDADALFLISKKPELISGYDLAILTPNVVEFKRLADAVGIDSSQNDKVKEALELSKKLGNVTILRKGEVDIIAKGEEYIESNEKGSNRRAGGQGDTLTGIMATLVAWTRSYKENIWDHPDDINHSLLLPLAAYGASVATRKAAKEAFKEKGRAMQATDLHSKVGYAYHKLFE